MKNISVDKKLFFRRAVKMNELNRISWETFTRTGDIEAYLLYKSLNECKMHKDKDEQWQRLEQEVLS